MYLKSSFILCFILFIFGLTGVGATQPAKLKYIPQALKATRIPAVINPSLPPEVQRRLAQSIIPAAKNPVNPRFLSGPQALKTYIPGWRSELSAVFSPTQLNQLEQTFSRTDDWLIETDSRGHWITTRSSEWDYPARFAQLLSENTQNFSAAQLKFLFGKRSRLDDVFTRLSLQAFLLANGHAPRSAISRQGKAVPVSQYTESEQEEVILGRKIRYNIRKHTTRVDPKIWQQLLDLYVVNRASSARSKPKHTPTQPRQTAANWLQALNSFMETYQRYPRTSISRDGKVLRLDEYSEQELQEVHLAKGVHNTIIRAKDPQDPVIVQLRTIKEQYVKEIAAAKTPEQWLEELQTFINTYARYPRSNAKDSYDPEDNTSEALQAHLESTLATNINALLFRSKGKDTPALRQLRALKIQFANRESKKTPQEWLFALESFLAQYQRYPRSTIYRDGKQIAAADYTDLEKEEMALFAGVHAAISRAKDMQDPVIRQLKDLKSQYVKEITPDKQPREWLELLEDYLAQHGRFPRENIYRNGQIVPAKDRTPQEREESALAAGVRGAIDRAGSETNPDIKRLIELRSQYVAQVAPHKTPQEWLTELQRFLQAHERYPRTSIHHNGHKCSVSELSEQEYAEINLATAVNRTIARAADPRDPVIEQLRSLRTLYHSK